VIHDLGPRAGRIFDLLQERILSGELQPGTRLPSHTRLAADFGVAPMTIRSVLARLQAVGLVSRERGRGTFVRTSTRPAVLVLTSARLQAALGEHLRRLGQPLVLCGDVHEALSIVNGDRAVVLVLCELSGPDDRRADFIRAVRRHWPGLPVAAVTSSSAHLSSLYGTPECPVLVVPVPVRASQLEEVLRLALADAGASEPAGQLATPTALRFRAQLLEAVEQAVIATDAQAHILYWNRGAERLYGWSAEDVLGRNLGEVIVAPELLERGLEIMALLRDGKSWSGEFEVRHRDGSQIPVLVTDSPIRDQGGRLVGIIGVAVDLTERKQAERERLERVRLQALLAASEAAQRELSEQLVLHVPYAGQLASDPQLPAHLRPIAGVVLNAVRAAAARLDRALELAEDA
jgi:PAS domain S-box-containing protein